MVRKNKMDSSEDEKLVNLTKKKKKAKVTPETPKSSSANTSDKKKKKKKKKKRKLESEVAPDKVESSSPKKKLKTNNVKALKKLEKTERLQYAMQAFLWWNAKEPPEGCQWETMEHAGVSFPEEYKPHGVKMLYDGKPVDLNSEQEEA